MTAKHFLITTNQYHYKMDKRDFIDFCFYNYPHLSLKKL